LTNGDSLSGIWSQNHFKEDEKWIYKFSDGKKFNGKLENVIDKDLYNVLIGK